MRGAIFSVLLTFFFFIILSPLNQIKAQEIFWGAHNKTTDRTIFFNTDSASVFNSIYNARQFLYDSLSHIATESGAQFQERVYVYNFQPVDKVRQLVISFPDAGRYIYYIKIFDSDSNEHVVYEYVARSHCIDTYDWLIITVPPIAYTIHSIEVGTFQKIKTLDKIGVSQQENVNKVVSQLISNNLTESFCNLTSFMADRERLPDGVINSNKSEVKPIISADGSQLYFHRQKFKENIGGAKDEQDIYVSTHSNNTWSAATNIGTPINNKSSNGIAGIMPGENGVFLINEYKNNTINGQGVSFSKREIKGWSIPEKVSIDEFYNNSPYFDFCISVSLGEMILAVDRSDSWGDQDLYVSLYNDEDGKWSIPRNLGEVVNTPLAEVSPYLAADRKTLYFASEGHLGYGGFDLFMTKRLDNSWTKWSHPENLGPIINSDDHDLYYSVSALADYAYFSSGTDNNRDIYRIPLPKVYKPAPVTIIQGYITTSDSAFVSGTIKLLNKNGSLLASVKSSDINGFYRAIIPVDSSCVLQLFKFGQLLQSDTLSIYGFSGKKTVNHDFIVNKDDLINLSSAHEREPNSFIISEPADSSKLFARVIRGQIINGATLRPLGTMLRYYNEGNIVTRALSNPKTGDFQVVLTEESIDSIRTGDVAMGTIKTPSPDTFDNHVLIKLPQGKSDTIRLATRLYHGMSDAEIIKINLSFSKRKNVNRYYYRMLKIKVLHKELLNDLRYLVNILNKYPGSKLKVIITCESDYKRAENFKSIASQNIVKGLQELGLDPARVEIIQASPFANLNKIQSRINTGIWVQLFDSN